jgi:hypothetical protein
VAALVNSAVGPILPPQRLVKAGEDAKKNAKGQPIQKAKKKRASGSYGRNRAILLRPDGGSIDTEKLAQKVAGFETAKVYTDGHVNVTWCFG